MFSPGLVFNKSLGKFITAEAGSTANTSCADVRTMRGYILVRDCNITFVEEILTRAVSVAAPSQSARLMRGRRALGVLSTSYTACSGSVARRAQAIRIDTGIGGVAQVGRVWA